MDLPDLEFDYYDAGIINVSIGPRREATLTMRLRVPGRNRRVQPKSVMVRFGGIANFEVVKSFFDDLTGSTDIYDGLHYLRYTKDRTSKPGSLFVELEFDRSGKKVEINCSHITVTRVEE